MHTTLTISLQCPCSCTSIDRHHQALTPPPNILAQQNILKNTCKFSSRCSVQTRTGPALEVEKCAQRSKHKAASHPIPNISNRVELKFPNGSSGAFCRGAYFEAQLQQTKGPFVEILAKSNVHTSVVCSVVPQSQHTNRGSAFVFAGCFSFVAFCLKFVAHRTPQTNGGC